MLTTFSSLCAAEFVKMTTCGKARNFINTTIFPFERPMTSVTGMPCNVTGNATIIQRNLMSLMGTNDFHYLTTKALKLIDGEWPIYASVKQAMIGSNNGLAPNRRQAITWTKNGLLLKGPFEKNFRENSIKIQQCPCKKMNLKISSAK